MEVCWAQILRVLRRRSLSGDYDAVSIALAEALDAPLLSRDAKPASAAGHAATISLI